MSKLAEIQAAEQRLLIHTYDRFPVLFVAGEDVYLIDDEGNRYLDLLSGIGVNALGYSSKTIQNAIAEQSCKLINAPASADATSAGRLPFPGQTISTSGVW